MTNNVRGRTDRRFESAFNESLGGSACAPSDHDCRIGLAAKRRRRIMGMREEYQAVMEKQLIEWKAQTERFKAGAGAVEAEFKAEYGKSLGLLHAKQNEAWKNFSKLKDASEDAWGQFKEDMDRVGGEVKDAAERMARQFKK
jgi:hypothetical protein